MILDLTERFWRWLLWAPFGSRTLQPTWWARVLESTRWHPRISPNKSWEGFAGGIVGCVIAWCIGAVLHVCGLTWPLAILCGVVESIIAVFGDLFESRIKRGVGVKDSGSILPGHGGLLDRTDSMLFGGFVCYFLLLLGGIL